MAVVQNKTPVKQQTDQQISTLCYSTALETSSYHSNQKGHYDKVYLEELQIRPIMSHEANY